MRYVFAQFDEIETAFVAMAFPPQYTTFKIAYNVCLPNLIRRKQLLLFGQKALCLANDREVFAKSNQM